MMFLALPDATHKQRLTVVVSASIAIAACVREPAERICPAIDVGDLVITELRLGSGASGDSSWIELYNPRTQIIDLNGIQVRFRRLDGSAEQRFLVRRSIPLAAQSYAVLSQSHDEQRSNYATYGFADDAPAPWFTSAVVDVESCGLRVDRISYGSLPATASYSLWSAPPSAIDNDNPANWCRERSSGVTETGTPGMANPQCQ